MKRNKQITKTITSVVLLGVFTFLFIVARLGVYSFWLYSSRGPFEGIIFTKKILENPKTIMKISSKKILNIYYIDNCPILCVRDKEKNSCIKLEAMKNTKLYNVRKTRLLFGTTILATTEPYPEINIYRDFLRRNIFAIDYNIDGSFSSYFYP